MCWKGALGNEVIIPHKYIIPRGEAAPKIELWGLREGVKNGLRGRGGAKNYYWSTLCVLNGFSIYPGHDVVIETVNKM